MTLEWQDVGSIPCLANGLKGPALAAVAQILPLVWELHMPWGGQKIVMYMYIYIYIYVCVCVCVYHEILFRR